MIFVIKNCLKRNISCLFLRSGNNIILLYLRSALKLTAGRVITTPEITIESDKLYGTFEGMAHNVTFTTSVSENSENIFLETFFIVAPQPKFNIS